MPFASRAADTAGDKTDGGKSAGDAYVLFTGTDIQVLHDQVLYRVQDVKGDAFAIKVRGEEIRIPMGKNPEKLKLTQVERLTARNVTVAKYKYDRIYTAAHDPRRKWAESVAASGAMDDAMENAQLALAKTSPTVKKVTGPGKSVNAPNPAYGAALQNVQSASLTASSDLNSAGFQSQKLAEELALQLFDAVEVQFEVSSARPIQSPYVVVLARYHEKDEPQYVRNWLFAKALDPIDAKPRKVFVQEGGFPPGYVLDHLQIHLYENGAEIATDLSENRAPLTREEAHEYLVIDYVATHKNDTAAPQVALARMPDDWKSHLKGGSSQKTYYVKVDRTGHSTGFFEDEACTTKIADSYYEDVLKNMLFLPALEKGKAIDSVAKVRPSDVSL